MATPTGIKVTFRTIRPEELETWAETCDEGFGGRCQSAYYLRHFRNDPFADYSGIFVAEAAGKLVSSVRVFTREIYLQGQRVTMGGIGEVCTLEDYKRRGLSGELLNMAVAYMNAKGLAVSMLFTGTNHHYARYGWFTVPTRYARLSLEGVTPSEGVRPMREEDFAAMRGVHGLFAGSVDGAIVREHPDYWNKWVRSEWKNPMVLERDGRVVAYIDTVVADAGGLWIKDFAELPGEQALMPLLVASVRALGVDARAAVPATLLSEDPESFAEHTAMMVRLNHPFTLGERTISRVHELAAALSDAAFFETDGF